jgi:hypothetical protein
MSKRIAAVPEFITRKAYLDLWATLGIDAKEIRDIECGPNSVTATVFALDEDGNRYFEGDSPEPAMHVIYIPVVGP